jgi:protein ImuB
VEDLLQLPREELIRRYGDDFRGILDIIEQNGPALIAPNVKQDSASWDHALDSPVEDFEQLIFLLNHGLEKLFRFVANAALSTEHLDIFFKLRDRSEKAYEIKTSFPTLDRSFWLKLINLRVSLDPPQSEIAAVTVTSHFTRPRPAQLGLYAVSRPQPESLLLTVNKLKKLVGEENVGVPVILDQRLAEPFILDADSVPQGREAPDLPLEAAVIAFSYFRPPIKAEVLVRNKRLVFIKTGHFSGRVVEHSGVWREDSRWWEQAWKTEEWDIEVEGHGVYRLCRSGGEWFLVGEYD